MRGHNTAQCRAALALRQIARSIRLVAIAAASATLLLVLLASAPAVADEAGSPAPLDSSLAYEFGWSVDDGQPGGLTPVWMQYRNLTDGCADGYNSDGPDEPMRAFRFKNSNDAFRVQTNWPDGRIAKNRRMIGSDLHNARREHLVTLPGESRPCTGSTVFNGQHQPYDWKHFDDNEWLTSPYYVPANTTDPNSGIVHALMHQERGYGPGICPDPTGNNRPDKIHVERCWFGSITSAVSTKDLLTDPMLSRGCQARLYPDPEWFPPVTDTPNKIGACYAHVSGPDPAIKPNLSPPPTDLLNHIVGTIPFAFYPYWGCPPNVPLGTVCGRHGYKETTNIIRAEANRPRPGYFVLADVSAPQSDENGNPTGQDEGLCLLWTDDLNIPSTWRVWNGQDFAQHPRSNENLGGISPQELTCEPVTREGITPWSLTYNTYLKKYMIVGTSQQVVKYMLSEDLFTWSPPQLLVVAANRQNALSMCRDGATYPVILDPDDPANDWPAGSANPNFDHPGAQPELYFNHTDVRPVEGNPACQETSRGNLGRMPLDFRWQRQATLDGSLQDGTNGYDTNVSLSSGCSAGSYNTDAGQQGSCASANLLPPTFSTSAYGTINTKWEQGHDVWYGSAFHLPSNFFDLSKGRLIKWSGANNAYGALTVNGETTAADLSLVRGHVGQNDEEPLVTFGGVPTNQWVWLEVHQKLGSSSGSALTEVYMDGRLMGSSAMPTIYSDTGTITSVLFGASELDSSSLTVITVGIDRSTVLGAQRGAVIGSPFPHAPETPIGLRASAPGPGQIRLDWNDPDTGAPPVTGYRIYKLQPDGLWDATTVDQTGALTFTKSGLGPCTTHTYRITAYRTFTDPNSTTTESIPTSPVTTTAGGC